MIEERMGRGFMSPASSPVLVQSSSYVHFCFKRDDGVTADLNLNGSLIFNINGHRDNTRPAHGLPLFSFKCDGPVCRQDPMMHQIAPQRTVCIARNRVFRNTDGRRKHPTVAKDLLVI